MTIKDEATSAIKEIIGFRDPAPTCKDCVHRISGRGAEDMAMYCNLNPSVRFQVMDWQGCNEHSPKAGAKEE